MAVDLIARGLAISNAGGGGEVDPTLRPDINALKVRMTNLEGKAIEYYQVEFKDDKFYHGDEELNYAKLKAIMEDQTKFLWLSLDNLVYIPNITIDDPNGAFAFSTTFVRNDGTESDPDYTPYISRIIINSREEIGFEEFALARGEEGTAIIEVGSAQETFDGKIFPKIPLNIAKNIYNTYTSGTPVIIRWKVMNAIPVEATVVGSDYVAGTKSFNMFIHDTYAVEYSYTDTTTDYAATNIVNLKAGGNINSISLNGEPLEIDANKNVDIKTLKYVEKEDTVEPTMNIAYQNANNTFTGVNTFDNLVNVKGHDIEGVEEIYVNHIGSYETDNVKVETGMEIYGGDLIIEDSGNGIVFPDNSKMTTVPHLYQHSISARIGVSTTAYAVFIVSIFNNNNVPFDYNSFKNYIINSPRFSITCNGFIANPADNDIRIVYGPIYFDEGEDALTVGVYYGGDSYEDDYLTEDVASFKDSIIQIL